MRLKPSNLTEFGTIYEPTKNYEILKEFKESGLVCAEIEKYTHASVKSCQNCFNASARRYGFVGIRVHIRGDRAFLINENLINTD